MLKEFFPAGGKASAEIEITELKTTTHQDILVGFATLPNTSKHQRVIVYQLPLSDGSIDYRAISASCPHQGADVSTEVVKPDGNIYCSLHRRPICVYSEFNQAFAVEKRDNQFFIIATS